MLFSGFVAVGEPVVLVAGVLLLIAAHGLAGRRPGATGWRLVRRLRWVMVSIAVLFFWLTPGRPVFDAAWAPTWEGLALGAGRAAALVLLALAANLLLRATPREELLAGLWWLARPLRVLGFSSDRLAVRTLLTLEAVGASEPVLRRSLARRPRSANPWQTIVATLEHALGETRRHAEAAPCEAIEVRQAGRPAITQWLWPLALILIFMVVGRW